VRRCAIVGLVLVALLVTASSPCHARGKGWKDVAFGAFAGSVMGGAMGWSTLIFYSDQLDGDAVWEQHFGYGVGAGFALGTTFGALIGWKDTPAFSGRVQWAPPTLSVCETRDAKGDWTRVLVVHPLALRF